MSNGQGNDVRLVCDDGGGSGSRRRGRSLTCHHVRARIVPRPPGPAFEYNGIDRRLLAHVSSIESRDGRYASVSSMDHDDCGRCQILKPASWRSQRIVDMTSLAELRLRSGKQCDAAVRGPIAAVVEPSRNGGKRAKGREGEAGDRASTG